MVYYEPTLLFRNNAIRRYSPQLSPISSSSSLESQPSSSSRSWLLNYTNPKDTGIISKACSLDRLNIKSSYWKIPDNDMNLTSMAISNQESDNPTLAISSGNKGSNLFIYEIDLIDNYLTHHNTISLSNIHSMKWIPKSSNYLITGNSKGYAHLISVPMSSSEESAEICKRFNHRKHLKSTKASSIGKYNSNTISNLNFLNNHLLSMYEHNLFYWDIKNSESQTRPQPISISSIAGLINFDPVPNNLNTVGICGDFGVSLYDLRQPNFVVPPSIINEANRNKLGSNIIKWNPNNENIFAAAHRDGIVRLWDIRKQDNFATLKGHNQKVVSLEWNNGDLFTGGEDGNIIHWDLTSDVSSGFMNCGLKEGLDSINFNAKKNSVEETINQRQCGTILPASNNNIISMCSVKGSDSDDLKVLSIDGSSFFGIHSKIYDAVKVNINSSKLYYTEEDIQLLIANNENSNATLINVSNESINEVTKPLTISRKRTVLMKDHPLQTPATFNNMSNTTLLGSSDDFTESESYKLDFDVNQFNDDDFNFTQPALHFQNSNSSAYSVDSTDIIDSSPESTNDIFNDSMDTLSTNPTIIEPSSPTTYKRDSSFDLLPNHEREPSEHFTNDFKVLDLDLEKDDFHFDNSLLDHTKIDRMASIKTIGTHYYSVYSSY